MRYFEWTRPVPHAWQRELEQLGGAPNRRVPWLLLQWVPGDRQFHPTTGQAVWEPVQRYVIYEMIPPARLLNPKHGPMAMLGARDLIRALDGPEPRTLRYWSQRRYTYRGSDGKPTRGVEWVRRSSAMVAQVQWELWRAWHCYATPMWVLQGPTGGHKVTLSPVEEQLAKVAAGKIGIQLDWPAPGDLPYCGWDRRAFNAIGDQQALLELQSVMRDPEQRTHAHVAAERRMLARTLQHKLGQWIDTQVQGAISDLSASQWAELANTAPRGRDVHDQTFEAAHEQFLDAGGV